MKIMKTNKIKGIQHDVFVDDEDFDFLNKFNWHFDGHYAKSIINGKKIRMHRLILGLGDPNIFADHIDMNKLNNQRCNLRICRKSDNQRNIPSRKGSSSKYLGVGIYICKNKGYEKKFLYWRAIIKFNGKDITIGLFKNEEDAALAYNKFCIDNKIEFARLNIIEKPTETPIE